LRHRNLNGAPPILNIADQSLNDATSTRIINTQPLSILKVEVDAEKSAGGCLIAAGHF